MVESTREKIQVTADKLYETVKRLIHEGNVRRLIIKQGSRAVMEIPLTVAAVGVLVAPLTSRDRRTCLAGQRLHARDRAGVIASYDHGESQMTGEGVGC